MLKKEVIFEFGGGLITLDFTTVYIDFVRFIHCRLDQKVTQSTAVRRWEIRVGRTDAAVCRKKRGGDHMRCWIDNNEMTSAQIDNSDAVGRWLVAVERIFI